MIWIIYLIIGLLNLAFAAWQGILIVTGRGQHADRWWSAGLVEIAFHIFLWPIQFLFWMVVGIHSATGWALERIFR